MFLDLKNDLMKKGADQLALTVKIPPRITQQSMILINYREFRLIDTIFPKTDPILGIYPILSIIIREGITFCSEMYAYFQTEIGYIKHIFTAINIICKYSRSSTFGDFYSVNYRS